MTRLLERLTECRRNIVHSIQQEIHVENHGLCNLRFCNLVNIQQELQFLVVLVAFGSWVVDKVLLNFACCNGFKKSLDIYRLGVPQRCLSVTCG